MPIRLVDRYVTAKILAPFGAVLCIGLTILLVERIVSVLNKTFGKGDVLFTVLEMLAYLAPYNLGFAIPIALYLSVLLGFGKMARENGIDAMLACGVSLQRMLVPALVFSFVLAAFSVVVVGWLQPHGRYAYRALVHELQNIAVYALVDEGVFLHSDGRTIIIDKIDRSQNSFEHIFIFEEKSKTNAAETTVNTAQSGILIEGTPEAGPVLRLSQGAALKISEPNTSQPRPHQWARFAQTELPLGRDSAMIFRSRGIDQRELTLLELFERQDTPPAKSNRSKMQAELHSRIVRILLLPILPILAVPFALGPRRSLSSVRFGMAFILLIVFHQILDQGAFLTSEHDVSPWLTQWLPFAIIVSFAFWRFWQAAMTVSKPLKIWQYLNFDWLKRRTNA